MTRRREKARPTEIPAFEWVAAAIGALLLAAAVVVLVREGLRDRTPPDLAARVERVEPAGAGWRVELVLENRGDVTVTDVTFTAELAGEAVGEVTLDRLPGRSARRAGLVLDQAAAPASLAVRATGYLVP